MCWIGKLGEEVKKQIAQEDIKVLKVLRTKGGKFYAYYQGTEYEFDKLYKTELNVRNLGYIQIDKGFHSYSNTVVPHRMRDAIDVTKSWGGRLAWYAPHGPYLIVLVECTIPKGSDYWINSGGEIVSNMIIINKVLE